ncbi:MAG: hypothetical protein GAK32_00325 [Pseudomonas fluorescens]|nr:MAG: hypothetical protein GAK32_00325 [Pseudomonas fluorescens]
MGWAGVHRKPRWRIRNVSLPRARSLPLYWAGPWIQWDTNPAYWAPNKPVQ